MKLKPGERSILAYFPNDDKAGNAKQEILKMGIQDVQIDRVSRFGNDYNRQINNPIAGQAGTGTGLTFYGVDSDPYVNNDARVLMGADPTNSGYGLKDYGVAGGEAFLLTVVTTEDKADQVVKIVEKHDGYV